MRLRFAPSPTGYLHVGGARTALFNWLLACRSGGAFLLRIEDTDRDRSRPEHVEAILGGLSWLGIDWDEKPVYQADGVERHRADALRLLEEGRAYRDFTTQEEFARIRDEAVAAGSGAVTRLSRDLAARVTPEEGDRGAAGGEPFAVRFRVPDGTTAWRDMVHGDLHFENGEIEDFVILRSDGTPTYNLAVVSDDADMGITHVVRGDDHISNTPKQILLYEAIGRAVPEFGHLPMILGPDGKRLSKRHGAQAVDSYEAEGVLPGAMFNFLALLGWSPGTGEELLSREELVARFSMERVLRKGSVFDPAKLYWMNGKYMALMGAEELAAELRRTLERDGTAETRIELSEEAFQRMSASLAPRSRTLFEMAALSRPYIGPVTEYEPKAARKSWYRDPEGAARTLNGVLERLSGVRWAEEPLERELRALAGELGVGAGKVFQPLRLALTGTSASPGIFDVLLILGRKRSVGRVERALSTIRSRLP